VNANELIDDLPRLLRTGRAIHLRIDNTSLAWRTELRERLSSGGAAPGSEGLWLDGEATHPWLLIPWPDDLRHALLAVEDASSAAAAWAQRAGVPVAISGGHEVPTALQPTALPGARVLWLPAAGALAAEGWEVLPPPPATEEGCAATAALAHRLPIELAAIPTDFTLATARSVSGRDDLELDQLLASGAIRRSAPGRWHLPPQLRQQLRTLAHPATLAKAKRAWHATLLAGWPAEPGDTVSVTATFAEAAELWHDWWSEGRTADWVSLIHAWNRWARRHGEQLRVRFWHQAMFNLATARQEGDGTLGVMALGIARCEQDLVRQASARSWVERALTLLPVAHQQRVSAYLQLGAACFAENDLPNAIASAERGLVFGTELGRSPLELAALRSDLAFYLLLAGRPVEAEAPLRAAIAGKRSRPGHFSVVHELNVLTMLMIALDRAPEGVIVAEEAVAEATRDRHQDFTPYAHHGLAMALLECGRLPDAYRAAVDALATCLPQLHRQLTPLVELTQCRTELRARADRDTLANAFATLERALEHGSMMSAYAGLLLAEGVAALGDRSRALALLQSLTQRGPEGHVQAMLRGAVKRLTADPGPERAAIRPSEELTAWVARLLQRFDPPNRASSADS
jgi:tetratricopeptide (TPR) repeat protein